jgi:transposase
VTDFVIICSMKTTFISLSEDAKIAALTDEITQLKHQLDWFKRQLFGRKSEKVLPDDSGQNSLFDTPVSDDILVPSKPVRAYSRSSKKQTADTDVNDEGLRFDASVPQKVIDIPAPELQGPDADQYEIVDTKETCRLAQQPGSYVVLIYRRQVVRQKRTDTIKEMQAPSNVLEGCYCDVSLLAGLMVDKAVYHLPLHRQHQRMLDSGITVSRATLTNWIQKGIELLRPIERAQWQHILQSHILAMDEVPIKAGRKKGAGRQPGQMKQTYYWPIYGEDNEVAFTWSKSRGMDHAKAQLNEFSGILLTDGYAAYTKTVEQLNQQGNNVIHAACWAHTRRYFERSLACEPHVAQQALDQIAALYQNEKLLREKNADLTQILDYRQHHSEPLVTRFFRWIYEQRQRTDLLPSSPLTKALKYASERENQLKVFLGNPSLPPDTNHLERALRVIPIGRKNYLFCWSEIGAEQLGILQSLMVTCRLQGVNPYHYLVDVLQRVSLHPARDVIDLTPRVWKDKFADDSLTSDLGTIG